MANIFQIEANDIRNFIERHGYSVVQGADFLVVSDPVGSSQGRDVFNSVVIRDWHAAVKFVQDRS